MATVRKSHADKVRRHFAHSTDPAHRLRHFSVKNSGRKRQRKHCRCAEGPSLNAGLAVRRFVSAHAEVMGCHADIKTANLGMKSDLDANKTASQKSLETVQKKSLNVVEEGPICKAPEIYRFSSLMGLPTLRARVLSTTAWSDSPIF